jgi:hypothetical protein
MAPGTHRPAPPPIPVVARPAPPTHTPPPVPTPAPTPAYGSVQPIAARAPATAPGGVYGAPPVQPHPQPAVQAPGAYPSGGYPSAGYQSAPYTAPQRMAPSGQGTDRTTWMMFAGGLIVALVIVLAALIAVRKPDGPNTYTAEVISDFVGTCTRNGNSENFCQCIIDDVSKNVPFSTFKDFADVVDDDSPMPAWLQSAYDGCSAAEQPTSS